MFLFFDTETSGFYSSKLSCNHPNQARMCSLAATLVDTQGTELESLYVFVKPDGWFIPQAATKVHGLTTEHCTQHGLPLACVMPMFANLCSRADFHIAFNVDFDSNILSNEAKCLGWDKSPVDPSRTRCAMRAAIDICKLPGRFGSFKWPKLIEAHKCLFGVGFEGAHGALADVRATVKVSFEMFRLGHWNLRPVVASATKVM